MNIEGISLLQVTGGSLEESKEALAIAETDGQSMCVLMILVYFTFLPIS